MSDDSLAVEKHTDGTTLVRIGRDRALKVAIEVSANRKLGIKTPQWMLDVSALVDPASPRAAPPVSGQVTTFQTPQHPGRVEWRLA